MRKCKEADRKNSVKLSLGGNHVAIIVFQAFVVKEILRGGGGAQF